MTNKNNNVTSVSIKSVHSCYITFDENIYHALNIYETRVYMALRYHADFRKNSSDVEITINKLIEESKVKRSMLFYCLDSLEKKHFLIKRLNWSKGTFGKTNEYEVAQHLHYFKPVEQEEKPSLTQKTVCKNEESNISSFDNITGSYIEGVHLVDRGVQPVDRGVQPVDTVNNEKQSYRETYYPVPEETKKTLSLSEMLQSNPLNLPAQMIEDWITNRKAKKTPVTRTAWLMLNKQLSACENPLDAFEECVAAGWISFKTHYIKDSKVKKSHYNNDSTDWAKGIEKDIF